MASPAIADSALSGVGLAISHADPPGFWAITAMLGAAVLFSAWRALHNLRCERMIEDIPTSKTRSAPQGYVELYGRGRLMDGPPIVSPASGRTCVWYRFRVEEQETSFQRGSTGSRWTVIDQGESTEVFWLEDDTGRVAIDPEGAEVTAGIKEMWYSDGTRLGSTGTILHLLMDLAIPSFSSGRRRYREERIDAGMPLFALGLLHNTGNFDNSADLEQEVGDLLVEWKKDQTELKRRFDLNHDGEIDQQEWMLARQQARREVLKRRSEEQSAPDEPINIMRRTGDPNRPYLLSTCAQGTLARTYRLRAMLYIALFLAGGVVAIWLLNHRFGS